MHAFLDLGRPWYVVDEEGPAGMTGRVGHTSGLDDDTTQELSTRMPIPKGVRLLVLAGDHPGRSFPLEASCTIGRARESDLVIEHDSVSRKHAKISHQGVAWIVEDLGSRNGTLVNGNAVTTRRALRVGDRIELGRDVVLLFTVQDPAEQPLVDRERTATVTNVAATIAHDFNNLIGVVSASLEYLADAREVYGSGRPEVRECIDDARAAANEAAELAKRLLNLGRPPRSAATATNLHEVTREAARLVRRLLPSNIQLDCEVSPGLVVDADRDELHQILVNLCVNARDAMPDGGRLSISARVAEGRPGSKDALSRDPSTKSKQRYVVCRVSDTGLGMDEETQRHIFEPFFTTKPRGRGTGLGLAMVYWTVRNRGGEIEVTSKPGKGTTFDLYLPAASAGMRVRPTLQVVESMPGVQGTPAYRILVCDRDPLVLRTTARILGRHPGVAVETASTRDEIAHALEMAGGAYDSILIDPSLAGDDGSFFQTLDRKAMALAGLHGTAPSIIVQLAEGDDSADQIWLARGATAVVRGQPSFAELGKILEERRAQRARSMTPVL
jgi:signal transduction histidine kinase/CheY-like chemotaxis protein